MVVKIGKKQPKGYRYEAFDNRIIGDIIRFIWYIILPTIVAKINSEFSSTRDLRAALASLSDSILNFFIWLVEFSVVAVDSGGELRFSILSDN